MANSDHLAILRQGVDAWNRWRGENFEKQLHPDLEGADLTEIVFYFADFTNTNLIDANLSGGQFYHAVFHSADLTGADLRGANLSHADLSGANFQGADLSGDKTNLWKVTCNRTKFNGANLSKANLHEAFISQGASLSGQDTNLSYANLSESYLCGANFNAANLMGANLQKANLSDDFGSVDLMGANLSEADLYQANLTGANLTGANLFKAYLGQANLRKADLTRADLREAHLEGASLVETLLHQTRLGGSRVYGASVWRARLTETEQANLIITPANEPEITVDNLEVAQFIYLLLNNEKIRNVIDTVARKVVLILGRFTPERKTVLDAIRDELRLRDYLPVLFDFDKPATRNITETVRTLAHLSRFIIADITDPSSIPQELYAIIPTLAVPVQPVLEVGKRGYSMFVDLRATYHWVLPIHEYRDTIDLLALISSAVIAPAEAKAKELEKR